MPADKRSAAVLVIAREPQLRRWLCAALETELRVAALEPGDLADPARHLDAPVAVVALGPSDGADELGQLEALRRLPAGRGVVLIQMGADEETVRVALHELAPVQVLSAPAPELLLRYAVLRAFPSRTPGRGARPNHRPAAALLGVSAAIRSVTEQVRQIAPAQIPALILGETGTGKELVARAIHEQSPRASQPFVTVNCGALPDSLLESELFGHKRGAFTGADRDKTGLFEHAQGGTVFLDEIGDTSPAFQMKLLRVLENKEIRPLGDTRTVPVDVRVVSATHHDLEAAVEAGTFRADLYYRLNAVIIYVPPLRRRRVDIPFLAQHFAEEFGAAHARQITLGEDFLGSLGAREFPGNVRELRNAVERAIALATPGEEVTGAELEGTAGAPHRPGPASGSLREQVDQVEREAIIDALRQNEGNKRRAADALGLTPPGLRYKIRRLGIEPDA